MTETTEQRIERLERVIGLQQQLMDRLGAAVMGQQHVIEALASMAGVKIEQPRAHVAPLVTPN